MAQDGLTIFKGNPINKTDLEKALQGCSSIISVLNISRTSDFPWSKLRTPKNYLSEVMKNVIEQTKNATISRIVICSAWGLIETRKDIPFWFRWTIDYSNIKHAYIDHEKQEQLLENSSLDYTIIRPTGLLNGNKNHKVKESYDNIPKPSLTINRKTLAKFMVDSIENDTLIKSKLTLSKA